MEESREAEARWAAFLSHRRDADRTWLVEYYKPLVEQGVRTFHGVRKQDVDDLRGAGFLGLVESVDKWDPQKMRWLEFARFRIRAAMIDHIRAVSWVGKSTRTAARKLEEAEAQLTGWLNGRPPTDQELAIHLGLPDTDALAALRSKLGATEWGIGSLDAEPEEGGGTWAEALPDPRACVEDAVDRRDRAAVLESILDRLPARTRDILTSIYFRGEKMQSIAKRLGVHPSRVTQIEQEALVEARRLAYEVPLEVTR